MKPLGRSFVQLCVCVLLASLAVVLASCEEQPPTPSPVPLPDTLPTPTPAIEQIIEGQTFAISFGEQLLATEELHVDRVEDRLVVSSEVRWHLEPATMQRRTLIVSGALAPVRYDLESMRLDTRSVWVGERTAQGMDCLNNNLDWVAPVLFKGIAPSPEIMLERAPSALPFVLMMLRYQRETGDESDGALSLSSLDIMEDYPVSRPLTVTLAPERQGAVIGTTPLKGQIGDAPNSSFVLWFRLERQVLYRVEIPDYQFGFWDIRTYGELGKQADLTITNVSSPAERPTIGPEGEARRTSLSFEADDGTTLQGTLILPTGEGSFPCLVLHSEGGMVPRWDPGDGPAERGWAVYCYDKRGLGESEGDYRRGPLDVLARDAIAAANMLSERSEIDPERIVFLGLRKGGHVGALTVGQSESYAAAVLGSCTTADDVFPGLAEHRIRHILAPFYGWNEEELQTYLDHSLERWQTWLFEGGKEVSLLGRRASLAALEVSAATDLHTPLSKAQIPVLLLHGEQDHWTPVEGAVDLHKRLLEQGRDNVTLQTFEGLGSLRDEGNGFLAPGAEKALFAWLEKVLAVP